MSVRNLLAAAAELLAKVLLVCLCALPVSRLAGVLSSTYFNRTEIVPFAMVVMAILLSGVDLRRALRK